eukprot:tig00000194_g14786.t1
MKRKATGIDNQTCSICLGHAFCDECVLVAPPVQECGHTFCDECILAFPSVRGPEPRCPVCFGHEYEIESSEIVRGDEIGRGTLGAVYAGTWARRQYVLPAPIALKVIEAATLGAAEERAGVERRLRREVAILSARASTLRASFLVQFRGVIWHEDGGATLVMERAEKSLRALLAERRLTFAECLDLGMQLLDALAHLHSHNIVHRSVKPSNILVFRRRSGRLEFKLADYGVTFPGAASAATAASMAGTAAYAAPETLLGEGPAHFAGDVYGAAVVLNEALAGRAPFAGVPPFQVLRRATAGQRPELATEAVPAAVHALLKRMWAAEAAVRPSAEEARSALLTIISSPTAISSDQLRRFFARLFIRFQESGTVLEYLFSNRINVKAAAQHGKATFFPNEWSAFKAALFHFTRTDLYPSEHEKPFVKVLNFRARTSSNGDWIDLTRPNPNIRLQEGGVLIVDAVLEREPPSLMLITVKSLGETEVVIVAHPDLLLEEFKDMYQDRTGVLPDQQRMVSQQRILEDGKTFRHYGIQEDITINVVLKLRGDWCVDNH